MLTIAAIPQRLGEPHHEQLCIGVHKERSTRRSTQKARARARQGCDVVTPVEALLHLNEAQRLSRTGSYIANFDDDVHQWSDELYRICELEIGTAIKSRTLAEIVVPEDLANFTGAIEEATTGLHAQFEIRILTKTGALKHLHGVARRFSDAPLFVGAITDVTERKNAEARLRVSESFLAKAQELSLTGSFSWSTAAPKYFIWSEQMNRTFEIEPGLPITVAEIRERYHPEDRHLIDEAMENAQFGIPVDFEHRITMPDGRVKHLHVFATMDPQNSTDVEYFGAVQDVTQRRLGQEALENVRAELAHAARAMSLGTLTASIAHEINQPLSGIVTNASTGLLMLAADPPDIEGAMETARRTIRDGRRASDILARLRSLFSKKKFVAERVDLNEAAKEVVALTRHDLKRHQISVETRFDHDLPSVTADRVQLQQVILNLILNAADAVRPITWRPRQLVVQTERDVAGGVRLTVCDNGVGILPEDFARLFEPFFTTKAEGMGIGLSVSLDIVERHDGRLTVNPNDEFGVTFLLSLPCNPGAGT